MGNDPVTVDLDADVRAYPPRARYLLGSVARQVDGLRAGLIRLLGPYTELAHVE